jgi:4-hydroxythreonine-4-phosphate dehydrogenase
MTTSVKPLITITMGDAAGIGPEIITKTLHLEENYRICCPLVVGEGTTMHKTIKLLS